MAIATASEASQAAATARRLMLATKVGPAGLIANQRVFFTAMFACLGGLLYGYNQGVFSGVLAMHSFEEHVSQSPPSEHLISGTDDSWADGRCSDKLDKEGMAHRYSRARCLGRHVVVGNPSRDVVAEICNSYERGDFHPRCYYPDHRGGWWAE
jgi:hypothetical protein